MSSKIEALKKLRDNINLSINGDPQVLTEAPTIIITNHNCLKDIFYLPMGLTNEDKIISLISSRLIYKKDVERQKIVDKFLYSMPIEAHGGTIYAKLCLDSATELLVAGNHLNIFPEGAYINDSNHVYKGRTGAVRILFSAKAKGIHPNFLPIAIEIHSPDNNLDSYNLHPNDKVTINILNPINYHDIYYNYQNSSTFEEKNTQLHKITEIGMQSIANSLNREYIDSYIELSPKGNVMFANGEKIATNLAKTNSYILRYKSEIETRSKSLKRTLK